MKDFIKNFVKEFKEFALKGNVMDMAIGVIIGGAFTAIVTAFTDDFINPIINIIGGAKFGGVIPLPGPAGNCIRWGDFLSAVVNFIIVALVLFMMLKAMNKLLSIGHKHDKPAEKITKECPFCKSEIPVGAIRCPHCTSKLDEKE
ncbi:MAG: large conductance mechanosensitive channel protein MscL [Lachnospiraceae bacterium]|jgi:large conductance mechanosensitive channel|nr:large conductance mechanosensitive channel protein MscL [Lachnospiraceae bacterium]